MTESLTKLKGIEALRALEKVVIQGVKPSKCVKGEDIDWLLAEVKAQQVLIEQLTVVIGDYELTAPEFKECEVCNGTGREGHFGKSMHISLTCGWCDGEGVITDEQLRIKQLEQENSQLVSALELLQENEDESENRTLEDWLK